MDWQLLAIAAAVGFVASIIGGVAGYGTGLILPVFIAPIVGIAGVMPTLSITMIMANLSRIAAFRRELQPRQAAYVMIGAVPAAMIGASIYAMLPERAEWIERPRLRRRLGDRMHDDRDFRRQVVRRGLVREAGNHDIEAGQGQRPRLLAHPAVVREVSVQHHPEARSCAISTRVHRRLHLFVVRLARSTLRPPSHVVGPPRREMA